MMTYPFLFDGILCFFKNKIKHAQASSSPEEARKTAMETITW